MKSAIIAAGALLMLSAPAIASADYSEGYEHRPGILLRLTGGIGYARTTQTPAENVDLKLHLGGPAIDSSIALGAALGEAWGIHATFGAYYVISPKASGEFGSFGSSTELEDASFRQYLIGGGITAWFSSNMYFTASVGAANIGIKYDQLDYADDAWGLGGEVLVGKEWFLGPALGLGFAVGGTWHIVPEKEGRLDDFNALRGFSAGARLSLTFN